jgi:hypothetical protein
MEQPCLDCKNALSSGAAVKSVFEDKYFKLLANSQLQYELFVLDINTNQTSTAFGFCPFQTNIQADTTDIIEASGDVAWACNKVDSFLVVKTYKIADVCHRASPQINQTFTLDGRYWYVDTVQINNKSYLPPCGYSPGIQFENKGQMDMVINSYAFDFSFPTPDSIKFSNAIRTTSISKTLYQRNFEANTAQILFGGIFHTGTVTIKYVLMNNKLVLTSDSGSVIFYCKN